MRCADRGHAHRELPYLTEDQADGERAAARQPPFSRPWHTGVLGVALLAYLLAVHLAQTSARPDALRPQLPVLAAGLGLLILAAGATARDHDRFPRYPRHFGRDHGGGAGGGGRRG